jgi:hypothetical protein
MVQRSLICSGQSVIGFEGITSPAMNCYPTHGQTPHGRFYLRAIVTMHSLPQLDLMSRLSFLFCRVDSRPAGMSGQSLALTSIRQHQDYIIVHWMQLEHLDWCFIGTVQPCSRLPLCKFLPLFHQQYPGISLLHEIF